MSLGHAHDNTVTLTAGAPLSLLLLTVPVTIGTGTCAHVRTRARDRRGFHQIFKYLCHCQGQLTSNRGPSCRRRRRWRRRRPGAAAAELGAAFCVPIVPRYLLGLRARGIILCNYNYNIMNHSAGYHSALFLLLTRFPIQKSKICRSGNLKPVHGPPSVTLPCPPPPRALGRQASTPRRFRTQRSAGRPPRAPAHG